MTKRKKNIYGLDLIELFLKSPKGEKIKWAPFYTKIYIKVLVFTLMQNASMSNFLLRSDRITLRISQI